MRIADKVKLVFFTLLFIPLVATSCCARGSELSTDDMEYLRNLAEDTFRYIDFFIAEETGFPYDSDKPGELTNTTNIGLFLASLGIGYQIGLTDREHAIGRAEKIIYSLQRIQTWNGLYNNLLSTSGKTEIRPGANAISDFNKLVAGLIIVSETFPELKDRAMGLVNRINWSPFYNQGTGSTYTGYDLEKKEMIAWGTPFVGADTLLASFLMIASGQVPPETWKRLDRSTEKRYDFEYYTPGWQGGGLFMQFICGMFLDDRGSDIGYSKANFARAQMVHAHKKSAHPCGAGLLLRDLAAATLDGAI